MILSIDVGAGSSQQRGIRARRAALLKYAYDVKERTDFYENETFEKK